MVRKNRVWFPGATYHITSRGNRRGDMFCDIQDRLSYMTFMKEALDIYNGKLHCYCLMTNHVHLLIETEDINVSDIMMRLNLKYAKYFNKKYEYTGHLMQGRYGANIIEDNVQFLTTSSYIHLNPVKAKIVAIPEDYIWSSYSIYAGIKKNELIVTDKVLSFFQGNKFAGYAEFVNRVGTRYLLKPAE